jgi:CubicO group peptidase (beta-lactamase class C family)
MPTVTYLPTPREWETKPPAELGLREDGLAAAIAYHRGHESQWPRDFITESGRFIGVADEPFDSEVLGPVRPRKEPNGLILRHGYLAAEWGDTQRADMSFSIAKSYLAVLAGLAHARGLIRDLDEPVAATAIDDHFASEHNRAITWRHMLTQSSEWQGTLWGKPDSIDHNRDIGKSELGYTQKGQTRPLQRPGTFYEYNDVRVNRLSLSLLQRFRRALPDVLRATLMDPIGATSEWQWHGYRNSWVDLDGQRLSSVPGGSHWGGGLWMSSRDHARFGLLVHRNGNWRGQQLLDARWCAEMRRASATNPQYGLLWWLNTGRQQFPGAPESCYAARGAGSNVIWIDPEHDLIAVVRWIDKASVGGFVKLVVESVQR